MTDERRPLRVLQVEDSPDDADLVLREVRSGGFDVVCERVQTADALREALGRTGWDIVLADWMMPLFSAPEALAVVRASRPDVPFIIVSGTVGEETAVAALKAGADDFMLKGSLWRLVPAIERSLRDAETRRERRRAEAALAASEMRFRSVIDASTDMISIMAADGTILYVSSAVKSMLGYEPAEVTGRSAFEIVHPADVERLRRSFTPAVSEGRLADRVEYRARHADGSWRTLESVGTSLMAVPAVAGVAINTRDVTERVELERQLRQAQKMEAIGLLAGGIAHDFNNLLTVVLANADLAAAELGGRPDLAEALHDLRVAARRGQVMVRNLMGFSRQRGVESEPLALGSLVERFAATLRRLLPENVDVRFTAAGGLPCVLGDEGAIEQMLLNLATNARDAMSEGGTLDIAVSVEEIGPAADPERRWLVAGRYVCVSVTDSGIGMDEETRRRIFEPFFTRKPAGEGTGLGMPMVYGLMKQHGGFVLVDSAPGRGATVRLLFPATAETVRPPKAAAEQPRPAARRGTETVLVVEDEEALRRAARRILEREGYQVLVATDGREALELLAGRPRTVDLVFTDLVMPKLGGLALYQRVCSDVGPMRFLIASGYAGREAREQQGLPPNVPFVHKPWALEELVAKVREALDAPLAPA